MPTEIILILLKYLPGSDLKSIRLVCKDLARLIEPMVFEKILLLPLSKSAMEITELATPLRQHVRSLCYDGRWYKLIPWMIRRIRTGSSSCPQTARFLRQLKTLQQQPFSDDDPPAETKLREVVYLVQVFLSLPKLRSVVVQEVEDKLEETDIPRFYKQLLRQTQTLLPNDQFKIDSIKPGITKRSTLVLHALVAVRKPLETVTLTSVDLHDLICGNNNNLSYEYSEFDLDPKVQVLKEVRSFKIHLSKEEYEIVIMDGHFRLLSYILDGMEKLESLDLKLFDTLTELDAENEQLRADFSELFNFLCPRLSHLSLSGIAATEHTLIDLVSQHAGSLTSLRISEAKLITDSKEEHGQACWVRVIKFLQSGLHLKEVDFSGTITNEGSQTWKISPDRCSGSNLKFSITNFIISGGTCPLEEVAVDYPRNGRQLVGDESWFGRKCWYLGLLSPIHLL
jgi:F-box-like